jgi:hypothetical protein
MSQAVLFALDALKDELDNLHQKSNSAIFEHRPVTHGNLRYTEGAIRAAIAILESITPAPDHLPANDGEGLHRGPLAQAG